MQIADRRLGEVLCRRDHLRSLANVNPVAHLYIEEAAIQSGRWAPEVRESAILLLDQLGANERGSTRLGLSTAMAVISDHSRRSSDDTINDVRAQIEPDSLLRLALDAIVSYSDTRSAFRESDEKVHVAAVLGMLIYMFRAQEQAGELASRMAS